MTADRKTLQALLERVKEAKGGDRDLDLTLARTFVPDVIVLRQRDDDSGADPHTYWKYTGSIDDALALVERVLPGWEMERRVTAAGTFVQLLGPEYIRYEFMGENNRHKSGSVAVRGRDYHRADQLAILEALLVRLLAQTEEVSESAVERA